MLEQTRGSKQAGHAPTSVEHTCACSALCNSRTDICTPCMRRQSEAHRQQIKQLRLWQPVEHADDHVMQTALRLRGLIAARAPPAPVIVGGEDDGDGPQEDPVHAFSRFPDSLSGRAQQGLDDGHHPVTRGTHLRSSNCNARCH